MYQPLLPCPSCQRHVRTREAACPFCATALTSEWRAHVPALAPTPKRLSRAAAFVFGATVGVAACSGEAVIEPGGEGGGGADGAGGAGGSGGFGGSPIFDAGPDDDGGNQTLYGDPAIDAGTDDGGGGEPIYGAAPPPEEPPKN